MSDLSLEEIGKALPGTGEVMASVGRCFAMSWHAAHAGGWDLAAYFFRRTRSLLRGLSVTRPKYREQLRAFDADFLEPAYQALLARDLAAFDARYDAATGRANEYHVETGHAYVRWRLPAQPPDSGLELGEGS